MEQHEKIAGAVIIGAGHAGVQVAESLRLAGWTAPVTILDSGQNLPYQRPPLSKDYLDLAGKAEPLPLRSESFYAEQQIELRLGVLVTGIDRQIKTIALSTGEQLPYSQLVFATGAANRTLDVPGAGSQGIVGLKSLDDARILRERLRSVQDIVVVGAGFIGLEFASAAATVGKNITVLEHGPRPMARALSPVMSGYFADYHKRNGVNLRLGEGIAAFEQDDSGKVRAALSTAGQRYAADLVVVGIGVEPRTRLASTAGLETANGILVDEYLQTRDPWIHAIGDCASFPHPNGQNRIRLESVQNATDQARHVARQLAGEQLEPYQPVPWFWSVQGRSKLKIAGLSSPVNHTVVRGSLAAGKFSVYCFDDNRLVAVESVNRPSDHVTARKLLEHRTGPSPEECTAPEFDLKSLLREPLTTGQ